MIYKKILPLYVHNKFTKLEILFCTNNKITELNKLPNTLKNLYCSWNKITELKM